MGRRRMYDRRRKMKFLELLRLPESETAEKEAAKAPPKPLSRGAAPIKDKAAPPKK